MNAYTAPALIVGAFWVYWLLEYPFELEDVLFRTWRVWSSPKDRYMSLFLWGYLAMSLEFLTLVWV